MTVAEALRVLVHHASKEDSSTREVFTQEHMVGVDTLSLTTLCSTLSGLAERQVVLPRNARMGIHSCWMRSPDRPHPWPEPPAAHRRFNDRCVYAPDDKMRDLCLFCGEPEERK